MPRFPYTDFQIEELVQTEKHPRDWERIEFRKVQKSDHSRRADVLLERTDGRSDRLRLVVTAGRLDIPESYKAVLMVDDTKVRGIDHHAVAQSRFYQEVIPKGWHEDLIDPNLEQSDNAYHRRLTIEPFNPSDLRDFLQQAARRWNILLPDQSDYLL